MKELHEKIKAINTTVDIGYHTEDCVDFKVNTGLYSRNALRLFDIIFEGGDNDYVKNLVRENFLIQNFYSKVPKVGIAPRYTFLNNDGEIYFVVRTDRWDHKKQGEIEVLLMYHLLPSVYNLAKYGYLKDVRAIDIERLSNALSGYEHSLEEPFKFSKPDVEVYEEYKDMYGCPFDPFKYVTFQTLNNERQQLAQKCSDDNTLTKEITRLRKRQSDIYDEIMRLCE